MRVFIITIVTVMVLTSCGMFRPMYVERTDTVRKERKDTITKTITKTVNDTTKEVHNYYYTINNAGDTMLTNQNHFHYHSNETNDSSDYYRNLWMMEKEKGETHPLPPPSMEGNKLAEIAGWLVAGLVLGMLLFYIIRKKLSPQKQEENLYTTTKPRQDEDIQNTARQ